MTHPYLPGVPAPSDLLVKAGLVQEEIEWREKFGFDCADLLEEYTTLIEQYTMEVVFARRVLPREATV